MCGPAVHAVSPISNLFNGGGDGGYTRGNSEGNKITFYPEGSEPPPMTLDSTGATLPTGAPAAQPSLKTDQGMPAPAAAPSSAPQPSGGAAPQTNYMGVGVPRDSRASPVANAFTSQAPRTSGRVVY